MHGLLTTSLALAISCHPATGGSGALDGGATDGGADDGGGGDGGGCDPSTATVEGVGDFTDLQAAFDAVPDGGLVRICGGTWTGGFRLERSATITASDGSAPVVDAAELGSALHITADVVALTGLTLQNGAGTDIGSDRVGGGLFLDGVRVASLDGCVLQDNQANLGGGLFGRELESLLMVDTTLLDNEAQQTGGALLVTDSETVELSGVTVSSNRSERGGGLYLERVAAFTAVGMVLSKNDAGRGYGGGGLLDQVPLVTLTDSMVEGNTAFRGAGLRLEAPDGATESYEATLTGSTFQDNIATSRGGALHVGHYTSLALTDSDLVANSAVEDGGGACFLRDVATVTVDGGTLASNLTDGTGGAVSALEGTHLELAADLLSGNEAASGGAIWLETQATLHATGPWVDNLPEDLATDAGESWELGEAEVSCDADGHCTVE